MEIRRKKKKLQALLPLRLVGGLVGGVLLATWLCLLRTSVLHRSGATTEDANYQLTHRAHDLYNPYPKSGNTNNNNNNDKNKNQTHTARSSTTAHSNKTTAIPIAIPTKPKPNRATASHKSPNSNNSTNSNSTTTANNNKNNNYSVILKYKDPGTDDEIPLSPQEASKMEALRLDSFPAPIEELSYDVRKCPPTIPEQYPYQWSLLEILGHWNPDQTAIPPTIYQGLCAIDWRNPLERKIAVHYRYHELPFVVKHHPTIARTALDWSGSYDYLHDRLGEGPYRNEHSTNNHMMFWKLRGTKNKPQGWTPPTNDAMISFADWYTKAQELEDHPDTARDSEHYYLHIKTRNNETWLYEDLPFFKPTAQNDIFMVDTRDTPGINCRLGSRGTIAELHFDMSRNFILMLRGQKRYILAHPDQCINMELYANGHPSARHSSINWSDPDSWRNDGKHFRDALANEIVLEAGDGLYLPTFWFHFIVSLSLNYQCNARSGVTYEYEPHMIQCGF